MTRSRSEAILLLQEDAQKLGRRLGEFELEAVECEDGLTWMIYAQCGDTTLVRTYVPLSPPKLKLITTQET